MMKNAFYFTLKALVVLKIFKFLLWLFSHVLKQLDYKDKANLKFYDVAAWLAKNCNTWIAPNSSRSKGHLAMKFGQLIEYIYNMRNIFFLENHTQIVVENLVLDSFLEN